MALFFDPILGRLVSGPRASKVTVADAGALFSSGTVEGALQEVAGRNVQALWHYQVAAGTSGTLSAPTGGTLLLDWYVDGADALVCRTGTDSRPNYEAAYTAGGLLVTATLDSGGNWSLSGTPSAYPVSIIFAYTTPIVTFNTAYALENTYVAPTGAGSGDMTKAVYDADSDGKIDVAAGGTGAGTAAGARTALGLAIGTDVPALAHTHSGTTNGSKLAQANTHETADTDSAPTALHHTTGTGANQACAGNDARLSDARTPTAHAASHASGAADAVKLDDLAAPDDNTDLDASASKHGLLPKLGGGTTNFLRADGTWAAPAGGSLTNWGESLTTSSPNGTVPAALLQPYNAGYSNIDAVISPKGTGALLAQLPDGYANGGAKRGAGAVDLQTIRSAAADVASGERATIGGGGWNRASGSVSTVSGGQTNQATGSYSVIGGGSNNVASSTASAVPHGGYCTSSNQYSVASGYYASADLYGQVARASGRFAATGDAQALSMVVRNVTASTDATELYPDGSSNRMVLVTEHTWLATIRLVGRQTDGSSGKAERSVLIQRTANTTALCNTLETVNADYWHANLGTPTIAVTADDTNDALVIKVTAGNATSTRWVATVDVVDVGY